MKKVTILFMAVMLVAAISMSFVIPTSSADQAEVEELVMESYVNGAFNALDADAMRAGFHEDFAIYSPKGEDISKYPIAVWADGVEKRKSSGYDPKDPKNIWDHKFVSVDVTGHAAQVKIELYNQGKHVYTDYLSLLEFDSGWRIVAKVYQQH